MDVVILRVVVDRYRVSNMAGLRWLVRRFVGNARFVVSAWNRCSRFRLRLYDPSKLHLGAWVWVDFDNYHRFLLVKVFIQARWRIQWGWGGLEVSHSA